MSKFKLIFRSLMLMAILWVVNAMVQQWPVHVAANPPRRAEVKHLPLSKAQEDQANEHHGQVRTLPVDE